MDGISHMHAEDKVDFVPSHTSSTSKRDNFDSTALKLSARLIDSPNNKIVDGHMDISLDDAARNPKRNFRGGRGGQKSNESPKKTRVIRPVKNLPSVINESDEEGYMLEPSPIWSGDTIRWEGNESFLRNVGDVEDMTDFIHDCEEKEAAYYKLVVESYSHPVDEQGYTSAFRRAALEFLFPKLDIDHQEMYRACVGILT